MAKFVPEMHEGGITCYSPKHFTKEEFIKMIETNFPDNGTYENIVVALTTTSNEGTFQTFTFGKILDFNKMYQ